MKKISIFATKVVSITSALLLPLAAKAAPAQGQDITSPSNWIPLTVSTGTLQGIILFAAQGLATLTGIIAVVAIIASGILYMTAAGNEDQIEKAKNIIKYSITGIIIAVAAYSIVTFVITTFLK